MLNKYFLFAGFILFEFLVIQVNSKGEITNLKCTSLDESYSKFEYCFIKAVNRTYKYFSIKVNMYEIAARNIKINLTLLKNSNGYKPFLYNITIDACKFLSSKNRNPFASFFYKIMVRNSNMNHTCPYNHDLIWDKIAATTENNRFSEILPFSEGEYALFTNWYVNGKIRSEINFYGKFM